MRREKPMQYARENCVKTLHELQVDFTRVITGHDLSSIGKLIDPGRLTPELRLQIYRNNILHSFTSALESVYPVVNRLVGNEFFYTMSERFIDTHPSRSGNLHDFGRELPGFLRTFYPARGLPYLADVACLEWAYHQAFHARNTLGIDTRSFEAATLAQCDSLRFKPNPAARLIDSHYPILLIWETNQDDYAGNDTITLDGQGDLILVHFRRLTPGEYALLDALFSGTTLTKACSLAVNIEPELDLAKALYEFLTQHVLVEYFT